MGTGTGTGTRSRADVVVVGAGSAGLAATLTARRHGLDVITFEAMGRIGGRAFTTTEPFGIPWDVGCHWLHSASDNPFNRIADEEGYHYRSTGNPWHAWLVGKQATADEEAAIDDYIDEGHARALDLGHKGIDQPLSETVDRASRWFELYRLGVNAEWGVDPAAASTLDVGRYRDLDQNWPVEEGHGALVARAAASVVDRVELRTPVEAIAVGEDDVRVTTARGTVEAAAVVVTASTNVLADGAKRRSALREPLWERIIFAGEATSPEDFTTCHGAWESGIAAAEAVTRLIGRGAPAGVAGETAR